MYSLLGCSGRAAYSSHDMGTRAPASKVSMTTSTVLRSVMSSPVVPGAPYPSAVTRPRSADGGGGDRCGRSGCRAASLITPRRTTSSRTEAAGDSAARSPTSAAIRVLRSAGSQPSRATEASSSSPTRSSSSSSGSRCRRRGPPPEPARTAGRRHAPAGPPRRPGCRSSPPPPARGSPRRRCTRQGEHDGEGDRERPTGRMHRVHRPLGCQTVLVSVKSAMKYGLRSSGSRPTTTRFTFSAAETTPPPPARDRHR